MYRVGINAEVGYGHYDVLQRACQSERRRKSRKAKRENENQMWLKSRVYLNRDGF